MERKFLRVDIADGDWINLERKVTSCERMSDMTGLVRREKISSKGELWFGGF